MSSFQRQFLYRFSEHPSRLEREDETPDSFSFIVRVWKETSDEQGNLTNWRGSIEQVGNNQRVYIQQMESILTFIEEQTGMRAKTASLFQAWWQGVRRWWGRIRNELS